MSGYTLECQRPDVALIVKKMLEDANVSGDQILLWHLAGFVILALIDAKILPKSDFKI